MSIEKSQGYQVALKWTWISTVNWGPLQKPFRSQGKGCFLKPFTRRPEIITINLRQINRISYGLLTSLSRVQWEPCLIWSKKLYETEKKMMVFVSMYILGRAVHGLSWFRLSKFLNLNQSNDGRLGFKNFAT